MSTATTEAPGKAAIEYLQKHHALPVDADFDSAKKHAKDLFKAGKFDLDQYTDIADGKAPRDYTVANALHTAAPGNDPPNPNPKAGAVDVKRGEAMYATSKSRLVWPKDAKYGRRAGQDMTLYDGAPAYGMSQLERAKLGAWWKMQFNRGYKRSLTANLTEHEKQLLHELYTEDQWVGEYQQGGKNLVVERPTKLSDMQLKATEYLDDTTSGGNYLIPYFFDVDLVTYPLLYGELFPLVDLRELPISDSVKTPTLANLTINAGPAEGSSPGITLQTTTGLSTVITSSVYNMTGALTVGRDMLSDTPIELVEKFQELFNVATLRFLDKSIAVGDGSTYPIGISNVSGTTVYATKNGSAGPWVVADIEGMIKSLPKQYRNPKDKVIWVAADGQYFRIRGVSVSATDARRIFGYDYDEYALAARPFKVQNDLAATFLAYGRIDKYRWWRRKGLQIESSQEGKTLMIANELLIVARSRHAGNIVDAASWVTCTTGSKNAPTN